MKVESESGDIIVSKSCIVVLPLTDMSSGDLFSTISFFHNFVYQLLFSRHILYIILNSCVDGELFHTSHQQQIRVIDVIP